MEAVRMLGNKKGQGATEYLVLLAVVLIVALVAISLLGFFPGIAGGTQMTQSRSYWSGTAYPFTIVDWQFTSTTANLTIRNMDSRSITLTALTLNSTGTANTTLFRGGETKNIGITGLPACAAGDGVDTPVLITYTPSGGITGQKQAGDKNIVAKCQ